MPGCQRHIRGSPWEQLKESLQVDSNYQPRVLWLSKGRTMLGPHSVQYAWYHWQEKQPTPCCHNGEDVAGHLREGKCSLLEVLWVQWPSGKHLHPTYDIGWSTDGSSGCDCNSSGILVANPIPCKASHFHTFLRPTFHIKLAEVPRATPVWPPGFGMTRVVETDKMSSILHTAYWPFFQLHVFCSEGCTSSITKSRTSISIHIKQTTITQFIWTKPLVHMLRRPHACCALFHGESPLSNFVQSAAHKPSLLSPLKTGRLKKNIGSHQTLLYLGQNSKPSLSFSPVFCGIQTSQPSCRCEQAA